MFAMTVQNSVGSSADSYLMVECAVALTMAPFLNLAPRQSHPRDLWPKFDFDFGAVRSARIVFVFVLMLLSIDNI